VQGRHLAYKNNPAHTVEPGDKREAARNLGGHEPPITVRDKTIPRKTASIYEELAAPNIQN
jgi:hypothetical protein